MTPRKTMGRHQLMDCIDDIAEGLTRPEAELMYRAANTAAFLHRNQPRANRGNLPRTPYLEHPLRNTVRLSRWGVTDAVTLIASLLHDCLEDGSVEIVSVFLQLDPAEMTEAEQRTYAAEWMMSVFGIAVTSVVLAVSNPGSTKDERNAAYAARVVSAINSDPRVLLVKLAGFVDNAVGLYHNDIPVNRRMVARLAAEYLPLAPEFSLALERTPAITGMVSREGLSVIKGQLEQAPGWLAELL